MNSQTSTVSQSEVLVHIYILISCVILLVQNQCQQQQVVLSSAGFYQFQVLLFVFPSGFYFALIDTAKHHTQIITPHHPVWQKLRKAQHGVSITILNMIEMLTISGLSSDISKRIFRPELGKGLKTATYRQSWIAKIIQEVGAHRLNYHQHLIRDRVHHRDSEA